MQGVLADIGMTVEVVPVAAKSTVAAAPPASKPRQSVRAARRGPEAMIVRAAERSRARGASHGARQVQASSEQEMPKPEVAKEQSPRRPDAPSPVQQDHARATPPKARSARRWTLPLVAIGALVSLAGLLALAARLM